MSIIPLSNQVTVAAAAVALLSPTPTPVKTAWVASVPVILEQNAFTVTFIAMLVKCCIIVYLKSVPFLVVQVVITNTIRITFRKKCLLIINNIAVCICCLSYCCCGLHTIHTNTLTHTYIHTYIAYTCICT